jgi:hypothetical protein
MNNSNTPICFTLINNTFDNELSPDKFGANTWQEFISALNFHRIVAAKTDVPLIAPILYKTASETDDLINGNTRRCANNVVSWHMLPVDIDSNFTISEAIDRFRDYEYILFTTFSHQMDKDSERACDRFRMFFLLAAPVQNQDVITRKMAINRFITGLDQCSLSQSQSFYIPSCPIHMADKAVFKHNQGKKLDLLSFPVDPVMEYANPSNSENEFDAEFKEKIIEKLCSIGNVSNDVYWKIGSAMAASGFTFHDFNTVSNFLRSHRKENVQAQWRDSLTLPISGGYLINICRQHLGNDCFKKTVSEKSDYKIKLLQQKKQKLLNK